MAAPNKTTVTKDEANRKIIVTRDFNAAPEQVWKAWTDSSILDTWWAPRPWRAKTKTMDFREGGHWLYAMIGPNGEESWARVDYETIVPNTYFTAGDSFCDKDGNKDPDVPDMKWKNEFIATGTGTRVTVEITFASENDFRKILEMGFEEGFTMALGNLDEVLTQ